MLQKKQVLNTITIFMKWTKQQSGYLKKMEFTKLDIDNLIEEIESLGKRDKRSLRSQLTNLLLHLLKIDYQPEKHTKSWDKSIFNARVEISELLEDSPSLANELKNIFEKSYQTAREKASLETSLDIDVFPKKCKWSLKKVLTSSKWSP